MVKQMNFSAESRASLQGGTDLGDARTHATAGHTRGPLDGSHEHPHEPRARSGRDHRSRAGLDEADEHSHDLGLAMVGLDGQGPRATDIAENTPRTTTQASAPPAAIATFEAAGELLRALAAPVRIAIVVRLGGGPQCVHDLVE